jgi:hypothetical protein
VHDQVSALIDAENKALGRQVRVRMQVVEITANDTNTLGVDWSWSHHQRRVEVGRRCLLPVGQATSSGLGQLGIIRNGGQATTRTFIQRQQRGKCDPQDETYLLNNRPSNITSTESYIYPARSGSASSTNNNSTTVVPSVEPGN